MSYTEAQKLCIDRCTALMEDTMRDFDGSHDAYHVRRVRDLALKIADTIPGVNRFYITAAALLHDVNDRKYRTTSEGEGVDNMTDMITDCGISAEETSRIVNIAQNISYSKERAAEATGASLPILPEVYWEWACVHDADYLDAIGAIGVLRTAAFAGARKARLYVPLQEKDADPVLLKDQQTSCVQHFHDKLLLLPDRMKTEEGKRLAAPRAVLMTTFLERLATEMV